MHPHVVTGQLDLRDGCEVTLGKYAVVYVIVKRRHQTSRMMLEIARGLRRDGSLGISQASRMMEHVSRGAVGISERVVGKSERKTNQPCPHPWCYRNITHFPIGGTDLEVPTSTCEAVVE